MDNSYLTVTESANTYKYQVKGQEKTYLLAWSTTPWNKLATPALAVNPKLSYVKVKQGDEFYVVAESRLEHLKQTSEYQVIEKFSGQDLTSWEFEPHYDFFPNRQPNEKIGVIIADEFVTAEEGTGVVTLAIYGEDDYRVMLAHGVQLVEHVDAEGKLKPEIKPWAGMEILAVNPLVNADLAERGLVYDETPHVHSVATCYRCNWVYAPLPAWLINISALRQQLWIKKEKLIGILST
jgi:isoleucyl-tRNA synthetase